MSNGNFTNGSLVMRVWKFDGDSELVAKFQYWGDACDFADAYAAKHPGEDKWFMLAVCDNELRAKAFMPAPIPDHAA